MACRRLRKEEFDLSNSRASGNVDADDENYVGDDDDDDDDTDDDDENYVGDDDESHMLER